MEDNCPKAYKEVYEILKYVPKEDLSKIPQDLLKTIEYNMDKTYDYKIQENLEFEEQPMLNETKAILAVLYRDYWASEDEKARILEKQKYDIKKAEQKKKAEHSSEDLFLNRKQVKEQDQELIIYKESWYMKFKNFMTKIFNKNYKL